MKRIVLFCFFILTASHFSVFCQENKQNNIYMEFFGASNTFGVSYDTRIKKGSQFGYRIGISYSYSSSSSFLFENSSSTKGVTFPLEVNYLLGKKRHNLDLGVGLNIGIYDANYTYTNYSSQNVGSITIITPEETINRSETYFGYYIFSNIGYRYQRKKGFLFRTGISPSFNLGDSHGIKKKPFIYPYVSFGYSF